MTENLGEPTLDWVIQKTSWEVTLRWDLEDGNKQSIWRKWVRVKKVKGTAHAKALRPETLFLFSTLITLQEIKFKRLAKTRTFPVLYKLGCSWKCYEKLLGSLRKRSAWSDGYFEFTVAAVWRMGWKDKSRRRGPVGRLGQESKWEIIVVWIMVEGFKLHFGIRILD